MDTPVGALDRALPVYIAGHRGLVGAALVRRFAAEGFTNLVVRSRTDLDLRDRAATFDFVLESRPQVIIDAAARVSESMSVPDGDDNTAIQLLVKGNFTTPQESLLAPTDYPAQFEKLWLVNS